MIYMVTGATGFTGGALARALARQGHRVRCLARDLSRLPTEEGIEGIEGEIDDRAALARATEGADGVFHVAAMYRDHGTRAEFERVNVGFTRALLEAAEAAGVRRFVYVSTIGVHGSAKEIPANEDSAIDPQDVYQETKLAAEQLCRDAMAKGKLEIVIVRPCAIYGPGDTRMLKIFRMVQRGIFFFVGRFDAYFHAVYIDDLVDGMILAMTTPGVSGRTYILGGERYSKLEDYIGAIADAAGAPRPRLRLPFAPLWLLALAFEGLASVTGIKPPLHRRRLKFFKHDRAFSIARARRELGYSPQVSLEEGLRSTAEWYRTTGLLPR